jgi:hypothetical protein
MGQAVFEHAEASPRSFVAIPVHQFWQRPSCSWSHVASMKQRRQSYGKPWWHALTIQSYSLVQSWLGHATKTPQLCVCTATSSQVGAAPRAWSRSELHAASAANATAIAPSLAANPAPRFAITAVLPNSTTMPSAPPGRCPRPDQRAERRHRGQPDGRTPKSLAAMTRAWEIKGRKRHLVVDTEALPCAILIHPVDVQDRDAAVAVIDLGACRRLRRAPREDAIADSQAAESG